MDTITQQLILLAASYVPQLWAGLILTLQLLIVSVAGGFFFAVPLGLALTSHNFWLRWPAEAYSTLFRGSPMFVQLFLIYYGLPVLLLQVYGSPQVLRLSLWWPIVSSPFLLASVAFILNLAAYMAEDIRGGLQSIPKGEREAAVACGMTAPIMARRILLPSALRRSAPALFNQIIIALKATALVSTIAMRDLMGVGSLAFSQTYNLSVYLILGIIYLLLVFIMSRIFVVIEQYFAVPSFSGATT